LPACSSNKVQWGNGIMAIMPMKGLYKICNVPAVNYM
jgi:hypothetical protein